MKIEIKDLRFTYPTGLEALQGINLAINLGEQVAIVGQNGAGKTTLVRHFNGLLKPTSGSVSIGDWETTKHSVAKLASRIGYVFQNPENQLFALTVEKDIAFGPENLGLSREEIRRRVDWAMRITNTETLKNLAPYELSGGQQQRAALAGVLAMGPSVIVLDEPTSFLDPRTAEGVMLAVEGLRREEGITVVVVEHRLDLVARFADRMVVMDGGRVVADGVLRDVLDQESDRLTGLGVGIPRVSLLWNLLRRDSLVSGPVPTQVEEAAEHLSQRLRK